MSKSEFKIWLIKNDMNYEDLAKVMNISTRTITKYVSENNLPTIFVLALLGYEKLKQRS